MAAPLKIHFFPFFSNSPNANDDVDEPKIGKKTNKLLIIQNLLIQSRKILMNNFPPLAGVELQTSRLASIDRDHHATPLHKKMLLYEPLERATL